MSKRLTIVLPEKTVAILHRVAPKGQRSAFISRAVLHYVERHGNTLCQQLKAGYQVNAKESLRMAAEWFPLEQEARRRSRVTSTKKKQPTSGVVRSATRPSP